MRKAVWGVKGALDRARFAAVAAVVDDFWNIGVDAPADGEVDDVSSSEPDGDEEAEEAVGDGGVAEVFEAFGDLSHCISS